MSSASRKLQVLARHMYDKRGAFNRSMQHHLKDLLFKDGVHDPEETVETL